VDDRLDPEVLELLVKTQEDARTLDDAMERGNVRAAREVAESFIQNATQAYYGYRRWDQRYRGAR
jgi:hypothetical protein